MYILKLLTAWAIRILIKLAQKALTPKSIAPPPEPFRTVYVNRKAGITSLDQEGNSRNQRKIRCDIYLPSKDKAINKPLPIVVNLHGSGFVIHSMGDDADFCQAVADQIPSIVVDVDYAKAPELPFPNANLDVDTVLRWIQGDQERSTPISFEKVMESLSENNKISFKKGQIALTGFSSGGNLALTACIRASKGNQQNSNQLIKSVVAFYPSTNLSESPWKKPDVKPVNGASGGVLPPALRNFFYSCYIPIQSQFPLRSSDEISPLYANPVWFPESVTIITCSGDSLAREAKQLAEHIVAGRRGKSTTIEHNDDHLLQKSDPPVDVPDVDRIAILQKVDLNGVLWWEAPGQGHAWDKMAKPNSESGKLRDQAYSLAIERIRSAFD